MKSLFIILLVTCAGSLHAQTAAKEIQQGNAFYREQQFGKAADAYRKALEQEAGNAAAKMNLATALQKQGQEEEALRLFTEIATGTARDDWRSRAWYNKGAILSKQKRLEESIEAYKNALRLNPADKEARENLQKALLELKKKNPPKQDNSKKKKNQDQQPQKQPQSKMSPKEAEQRLKLLEQKEKEVQERVQKQKAQGGGSQAKDW